MVRTYASGCLALTANVTASVTASVSTSVGNEPAGTLYAEQIDSPKSTYASGRVTQSEVPTGTSIITTSNSAISNSSSPSHSTILTHSAMSTDTTMLTEHSIGPFLSASPIRHSTINLTRRSSTP